MSISFVGCGWWNVFGNLWRKFLAFIVVTLALGSRPRRPRQGLARLRAKREA